MGHISNDVYILSGKELREREDAAFQRGVKRGQFEERCVIGNEPVAMNCKNWKHGYCEMCGSQTQMMQVGGDFKCPHFSRR